MSRNGLFVDYCAADMLGGTQVLDPWEELAYRRICDLIYETNNNLRDDDEKLAWSTKTGDRWPQVKKALIELGKITSDGQRLLNARCSAVLAKTERKIAQKAEAGKASAEARRSKSLKSADNSTDVDPPLQRPDNGRDNGEVNGASTTQEPKYPLKEDDPHSACATPAGLGLALEVADEILRLIGVDREDPKWFGSASRVDLLLKQGWDPETLIYPAVKRMMISRGSQGPPGNIAYIEKVIATYAAELSRPIAGPGHVNGNRSTPRQAASVEGDRETIVRTINRVTGGLATGLPVAGDA